MDLIAILAASFLNLSMGCDAMRADVMRVGSQDYLLQSWSCPDKHGKPHHWRTWQRECIGNNGEKFWGRQYFLEQQESRMGFYVNMFGELQGGMGAEIENAYVPPCGS